MKTDERVPCQVYLVEYNQAGRAGRYIQVLCERHLTKQRLATPDSRLTPLGTPHEVERGGVFRLTAMQRLDWCVLCSTTVADVMRLWEDEIREGGECASGWGSLYGHERLSVACGFDMDWEVRDRLLAAHPYTDHTWYCIAYWVPGASEGYYLHVDRIYRQKDKGAATRETILLVKCFDLDLAEKGVNFLARLLAESRWR